MQRVKCSSWSCIVIPVLPVTGPDGDFKIEEALILFVCFIALQSCQHCSGHAVC